MNEAQLVAELTPLIEHVGLELDSLDIRPAGRRTLVQVVVDGDGPEGRGPTLDEIAEATREVSRHLDESTAVGNAAFTLEVTSRGVSRPLQRPAHWRRNLGRLVKISLAADSADTAESGAPMVGRIAAVTDEAAVISVDEAEIRVPFDTVSKAVVQAELTKRRPETEQE